MYEAGAQECWFTQKGLCRQIISLDKAPNVVGEEISFQAKKSFFRSKIQSAGFRGKLRTITCLSCLANCPRETVDEGEKVLQGGVRGVLSVL